MPWRPCTSFGATTSSDAASASIDCAPPSPSRRTTSSSPRLYSVNSQPTPPAGRASTRRRTTPASSSSSSRDERTFEGIRPAPLELGEAFRSTFRPADADLVIDATVFLHPLLTGELDAVEAIESGKITITGTRDLFERFVETFHIPPVRVA